MSDIKGLREISNDPFGKLLTALSKKFSAFLAKDQAETVENPEDIYSDGQDVESALKYHNFAMSKTFPVSPSNVSYYSATEPDNDKVKLFLAGGGIWTNLGNEIPDRSGFGHNAEINGDPLLIDGGFDLGVVDSTNQVKSIAILMNRPTSSGTEHLMIEDSPDLRVAGLVTGFSMFIRFRLKSLTTQGGLNRTIFQKIDDGTPTDAKRLEVAPDGRLILVIKDGGVSIAKQTGTLTIAANTVYDVFVTYAVSGGVVHLYVNNVDKPLTNFTGDPEDWQEDLTDYQMCIFKHGEGSEGFVYGDLFLPLVYWHEKIVSATEVSHHFTNKLTLADIPFGQVAISNYSATTGTSLLRVSLERTYKWNVLGVAGIPSFSTLSFTPSPSFTAGVSTLTRISLSSTLKYNIIGRKSLSRTYKWNVVGSASSTSFTTGSMTGTSFTA
jgi:hypothetical protein